MAFKLGLVGLCTSHPAKWVPVIRTLGPELHLDIEVRAAWDSGQTRPAGYAREFCRELGIPKAIEKLEDMLAEVDGIIIHTADWGRHVALARPFVEAGKSVLIDKPIVGNVRDANELLAWSAQGKRITGGSSLRFAGEVREWRARPLGERGTVQTAFAGCGTDEFNYGIHAYALLSAVMGGGIRSVQYLGMSGQRLVRVNWADGKTGLLSVGQAGALPFHLTAVTDRTVFQVKVDPGHIYRDLLECCLPYLCGASDSPPLPMDQLLEPELAALAARQSWLHQGAEITLRNLPADDPGYDGTEFALAYRRARMGS
jgi:Oxidoreductase family, NAD-binding Rossmann fold